MAAVADLSGAWPARGVLVESCSAFGNARATFLAAGTLADMGVGAFLVGDAAGGGWDGEALHTKTAQKFLLSVRAAKAGALRHGPGGMLVLVSTLVGQRNRAQAREQGGTRERNGRETDVSAADELRDCETQMEGGRKASEEEEVRRLRAGLACGADGVVLHICSSQANRLAQIERVCSQLSPPGKHAHKASGQTKCAGGMVLVRMGAGVRVLSATEQSTLVQIGVCGVLRPDDVAVAAAASVQACLQALLAEGGACDLQKEPRYGALPASGQAHQSTSSKELLRGNDEAAAADGQAGLDEGAIHGAVHPMKLTDMQRLAAGTSNSVDIVNELDLD